MEIDVRGFDGEPRQFLEAGELVVDTLGEVAVPVVGERAVIVGVVVRAQPGRARGAALAIAADGATRATAASCAVVLTRPGRADVRLVVGARGKQALREGNVDGGVISAGMVIGLIDDIPTCVELLEKIVADCRQHLRAALAMAGD